MIVLAGIRSERPLAMVAEQLDRLEQPYFWFDQRHVTDSALDFRLDDEGLRGTLRVGGDEVRLEDVSGVYWRLMDEQMLPELAHLPTDAPERQRARDLHQAFYHWLAITPARVVSRAAAMASNGSKPYQAQLIRAAGFDVPETLVADDPDRVRTFVAEHGRVIYKSTSGNRSIVVEVDDDALDRLDAIRWCPVQFQAYVEGVDVRVHVVGQQVFATRVASDAADYRYAAARGAPAARLEATRLAAWVEARCVALSERLELPFVGIDLRITPDDRVVCFEANPCPAFPYYEGHTGQPIARAVAFHLAGLPASGVCGERRTEAA
jgi:hypothetical protein